MLDIDGTIVGYEENLLPSKKVVDAIRKIMNTTSVCLVTGRSFFSSKPILDTLQLTDGYAVVNNGAYVLQLGTNKILYEQPITSSDTKKVISVLLDEDIVFYLKRDLYEPFREREPYKPGDKTGCVSAFYAKTLYPHEKIKKAFDRLSGTGTLTLHKTLGPEPDKFGFDITHVKATKAHGIEVVMKELSLERHEIIGCGDSYNDFPLLMSSGFKVAMGNAISELKEIADYVAPSVYQDGVADVIDKFIYEK